MYDALGKTGDITDNALTVSFDMHGAPLPNVCNNHPVRLKIGFRPLAV